jgi:predicted nucleotidyltransferase
MPLSDKALEKRDAGRDIGEELLQSVRQMKKDRKGRVHSRKVKKHISLARLVSIKVSTLVFQHPSNP